MDPLEDLNTTLRILEEIALQQALVGRVQMRTRRARDWLRDHVRARNRARAREMPRVHGGESSCPPAQFEN